MTVRCRSTKEFGFLKAYSGGVKGEWPIAWADGHLEHGNGIPLQGWVPSIAQEGLLPAQDQWLLQDEWEIHRLTHAINASGDAAERAVLKAHRKEVSHGLTTRVHGLYALRNMRGEERSVTELCHPRRPPGGTVNPDPTAL